MVDEDARTVRGQPVFDDPSLDVPATRPEKPKREVHGPEWAGTLPKVDVPPEDPAPPPVLPAALPAVAPPVAPEPMRIAPVEEAAATVLDRRAIEMPEDLVRAPSVGAALPKPPPPTDLPLQIALVLVAVAIVILVLGLVIGMIVVLADDPAASSAIMAFRAVASA